MTVFYRMCGIPSTNPSPIFQEDKFKLNKLCLRSFVQAFKEIAPTMIFILDNCSTEYVEMIRSICPFDKEFIITDLGINGTMLLSYDLAKDCKDDVILFQECDYLYRPGIGKDFDYGIRLWGLLSPYDHLNFYTDRSIHSNQVKLELLDDIHYRTTERNTMTFGMTKGAFMNQYEILMKYGYLDNDVWKELAERNNPLRVPIPSFATHMVRDFMAPSVDWKEIYEAYL